MRGFVWVFLVLAGLMAAVVSGGEARGLDVSQSLLYAPLAYVLWGVWAVGYLLAPKRRPRTLGCLRALSERLQSWRAARGR